jgi:hypothetical protein
MDKLGKVKADPIVCEMLYELQVEAFIEGISGYEPQAEEYGLTDERSCEIIARVILTRGLPTGTA